MSSLLEIENAISRLSREEFVAFTRWFEEEKNRQWDIQIELDSKSGAFDHLLREVADAIENRETTPADELCNNAKIQKGT